MLEERLQRAVGALEGFPIHDGLLNEVGYQLMSRLLGSTTEAEYTRLEPGTHVDA